MIELHDSVVGSVVIERTGTVTITFARLCVYHLVAQELYDIVAYDARLVIHGTTELAIMGELGEGWVSDGGVTDVDGGVIELVDLSTAIDWNVRRRDDNRSQDSCRGQARQDSIPSPAIRTIDQWKGAL